MNNKKLEKLFLKFDLDTLDSLCFLIDISKKRDLNIQSALGTVYVKVYDINKDSYNGRTCIDEQTKVAMFTLNDVINKMDSLSEEELDLIYSIVSNGYKALKKQEGVIRGIIPKIQIFMDLYTKTKEYNKEVKSMEKIPNTPEGRLYKTIFKPESKEEFFEKIKAHRFDEKFTTGELYNFFDKYSITDLEALRRIIDLEYDHNNERMLEILNKVHDIKEINKYGSYIGQIMPENYNLTRIAKKNDKLNDKELNMLNDIVDSVEIFINNMDVTNERDKTQIDDLGVLINKSIEDRKKTNKETKQLSLKRVKKPTNNNKKEDK